MKLKKDFNVVIGQRLRAMRLRAGLQQVEAAELLETSQACLSNVECGYTAATPEIIYCACCIYKCRLADVFPALVSAEVETA